MKTIDEAFKSRVNELSTNLATLSQHELELIQGRIRSEDLALKSFTFGKTTRGGTVTTQEFNAFETNKANIGLGGTGFNAGSTAKELADAILDLRQQISTANEEKQNAGPDSIFKTSKALNDLTLKSTKLSKALQNMATNTDKLNFLEQKLNIEREKTAAKQNLAKEFAFGSQEDQLKINRDIKAAENRVTI